MDDLATLVKSGDLREDRREIIQDSENIYIELHPEDRQALLAYRTDTTDEQITDAWNTCIEFGFHWVNEEYFDSDWDRYVCIVGMSRDQE